MGQAMLNLASITLVMGKVPTDVNSSLGCTGVALISGYWFQHHQCVGVFKDKDFVKTVDMDGQVREIGRSLGRKLVRVPKSSVCGRRSTQTWKRQISLLSLTFKRFLAT